MIGLAELDDSPVLCVLMSQGFQKHLAIKTGNDMSVNSEGNSEEGGTFFVFKNTDAVK